MFGARHSVSLGQSGLTETSHKGWSETNEEKEWDDFVVRNGGSIFHSWAWRRVLESGGSKPFYLVCHDSKGNALAVCPFFYLPGKHLRYLDSLPDSHLAGPVIDGKAANPSQIMSSLRKSVRFSPFNPVVAMRIRAYREQEVQPLVGLGFPYSITHGLYLLDLSEKPPEHIWGNGFNKHDRQAVKYYEQNGTEFGFAQTEGDYAQYVKLHKGSTIFSRMRVHSPDRADFVSRMRHSVGDRLKVALAKMNGEVIAGVSILCEPENSAMHFAIVRYSRENNIHSRVTYLYWKAINWASEQGFRHLDFGAYSIPKGSNPTHPFFKLRERFESTIVPRYEFLLPTSNRVYSIARKISKVL